MNEDQSEDHECDYQDTFGSEVSGFKGEGSCGGTGKLEFLERCSECGKWRHSAEFCPTERGKGKQAGQKGVKGESWSKGLAKEERAPEAKNAHGDSFCGDPHEWSFECDLLSVEVGPKDCKNDEDGRCVLVKHIKSLDKSLDKSGRGAKRYTTREDQFEVLSWRRAQ